MHILHLLLSDCSGFEEVEFTNSCTCTLATILIHHEMSVLNNLKNFKLNCFISFISQNSHLTDIYVACFGFK